MSSPTMTSPDEQNEAYLRLAEASWHRHRLRTAAGLLEWDDRVTARHGSSAPSAAIVARTIGGMPNYATILSRLCGHPECFAT